MKKILRKDVEKECSLNNESEGGVSVPVRIQNNLDLLYRISQRKEN